MAELSPSVTRFICIHGHFYQPARENPWLEAVEIEDSAAPYHDWNDRITAECYAPNGASRIVNGQNQIIRIVNNYSRISFNFGPTLLSWIEQNAPRTYRMILEGDRKSASRYGGHGSAMAQVYNHVIMPLANERDRVTQIEWGIADFERRYGRKPEGMWLAETAVDTESLVCWPNTGSASPSSLPTNARKYASPSRSRQAACPMENAEAGVEETATPRSIFIVRYFHSTKAGASPFSFTTGPISRAIAFEGLLNSGEALPRASRRVSMTAASRNWCTLPPTVKRTAIITSMATWRWPSPSTCLRRQDRSYHQLRKFPRALSHLNTSAKLSTTPPGAARTAWNAGARTADATAVTPVGTSNGARRCARPSTGCATR